MNQLQVLPTIFFKLQNGVDQQLNVTYQLFGQALHQAPIVLVNHALTGNSQVAGEEGWWKSLIGENKVIDLNKFTVIAFNIPGNGFDKKDKNLIHNYKEYTTKDIATIYWKSLEQIGVNKLFALIGGSLGGAIAWEMALLEPEKIEYLIPIATNNKASDWLIGNVHIQESILNQQEQPLEKARMHAMLLYRTPESIQEKFKGTYNENKNCYAVEDWLNYHGDSLQKRFTLASYKMMNHLLRTIGKELMPKDLEQFAKTTSATICSIYVNSDYMFTSREQIETIQLIANHKKDTHLYSIQSIHGHDAFLIEYEQLNTLLQPIFKKT